MDLFEMKDHLIINNIDDFNIAEVLECGQCFRFEELSHLEYKITALGKVFTAKQNGDSLDLSPMGVSEFNGRYMRYFDLERNYGEIKRKLSGDDKIMAAAVEYAPGIRILNQDFWEVVISFIISQNNRIPMIKRVIENLCRAYGEVINGGFSFPLPYDLRNVSVDEYMVHKTGFRARYIKNAVERTLGGDLNYKHISALETRDAKNELLKVNGIGNKVADCILLFGMGRTDVFPVDVWVKRVISELYFNGKEISLADIQGFAKDKWGVNAGFAQQYLFHFARANRIGAK